MKKVSNLFPRAIYAVITFICTNKPTVEGLIFRVPDNYNLAGAVFGFLKKLYMVVCNRGLFP